jgi:hypothetical protein
MIVIIITIIPVFYRHVILKCSSKDVLMRVVSQNLSPELTLVEKVSPLNLKFSFLKWHIIMYNFL